MGKSLVIVESPAKAKTINKYLGNDYVVKSSVGHIRDLPAGSKKKPVDAKERYVFNNHKDLSKKLQNRI